MKVSFEFVLRNAFGPFLIKNDLDRIFINAIFNDESVKIDWKDLAFKLGQEKEKYEIVTHVEGSGNVTCIMYLPSVKYGIATAAAQMAFSTAEDNEKVTEVIKKFNDRYPITVITEGRWCLWNENLVVLTKVFEDVIEVYLKWVPRHSEESKYIRNFEDIKGLAEFAKTQIGEQYEDLSSLIKAYEIK